jgi:hypothetical protein
VIEATAPPAAFSAAELGGRRLGPEFSMSVIAWLRHLTSCLPIRMKPRAADAAARVRSTAVVFGPSGSCDFSFPSDRFTLGSH